MKKEKIKKKEWRRSLAQWIGIGVIASILYMTGLHTPVIAGMQRLLLFSGLFNAQAGEITEMDGPFLQAEDYAFTLLAPDGTHTSLADYKGSVTFVNIWASWCPPCLAEMPTIAKLHEELSEQENIRFILLSVDEDPEAAKQFMEKYNYEMPYFFPASRIPAALQGRLLPTSYVISGEGQVVYKKEGIADYSGRRFRQWLIELSEIDSPAFTQGLPLPPDQDSGLK